MKYQLTLQFDNVGALQEAIQAVAAVDAIATVGATVKADKPAATVIDIATEKAERKAKKAKATNGKTAETAETEAEEPKPDPAEQLAEALKICRGLLESGNADAKAGLKALRDSLDVMKLSDVPLEAAAVFLTKAQALEDKHSKPNA